MMARVCARLRRRRSSRRFPELEERDADALLPLREVVANTDQLGHRDACLGDVLSAELDRIIARELIGFPEVVFDVQEQGARGGCFSWLLRVRFAYFPQIDGITFVGVFAEKRPERGLDLAELDFVPDTVRGNPQGQLGHVLTAEFL